VPALPLSHSHVEIEIDEVKVEFKKVETKIDVVEADIRASTDSKEKEQLRGKEKQLRKEKEQLREKEMLLLRSELGLNGTPLGDALSLLQPLTSRRPIDGIDAADERRISSGWSYSKRRR
jgi:hypothetical protein